MVPTLLEIWSGLFIPDPDPDFLPIPDPGVKKAPDWSATRVYPDRQSCRKPHWKHALILFLFCRKDFDDLPQLIKEGVEIHFAETYDDVYKIAFSPSS
jgi:hypothetical protein